METEGSLPSSEEPVIRPYPQPDETSPTHFNIVLKSMPSSSKWFSSIRFPHQSPICTSPPPLPPKKNHMPRPSYSFDFITRIVYGEENSSLSSPLRSFLQLPVTSFVFGPTTFLSSLSSNTLRVGNQISSPHKQQSPSELCFSVFTFLGIRSC